LTPWIMRERTRFGSVPSPYVEVDKSIPPMGFARAGRINDANRLTAPIARKARRDADGPKRSGRLMTERPVPVQALSSASAKTHAANNSHGCRAIEGDHPQHEGALHTVSEETRTLHLRFQLVLPPSGQAAHH
jgi:hypothetical protein